MWIVELERCWVELRFNGWMDGDSRKEKVFYVSRGTPHPRDNLLPN